MGHEERLDLAVCQGTTMKDRSCTMPAVAARRKRNASRAAVIGNSKIDGEIWDVRLMAKHLLGRTVSNELDLVVKKCLTEITQLIQSYCRLAELELLASGRPKPSEPEEYGSPPDTADRTI